MNPFKVKDPSLGTKLQTFTNYINKNLYKKKSKSQSSS